MASKDEILEAAHMVFMQYGIEKTTLDDIAKECGVKQQALYYYFNNKDDLIEQLVYHILDDIEDEMLRSISEFDDALDMIRGFMIKQLYISREHKRFIDMIRKSDVPLKYLEIVKMAKDRIFSFLYKKYKEIITKGITDKKFNVDSIESLIYLIIGVTTGYSYTILIRNQDIHVEEMVDNALNIILKGIQA